MVQYIVEVGAGMIGLELDGLQRGSRSALGATPGQQSTTQQTEIGHTAWDRFAAVGTPFHSLPSFQRTP